MYSITALLVVVVLAVNEVRAAPPPSWESKLTPLLLEKQSTMRQAWLLAYMRAQGTIPPLQLINDFNNEWYLNHLVNRKLQALYQRSRCGHACLFPGKP